MLRMEVSNELPKEIEDILNEVNSYGVYKCKNKNCELCDTQITLPKDGTHVCEKCGNTLVEDLFMEEETNE